MSLKCDTFFKVVDQVNRHVPKQFHHWERRFEFRWDHKCTFAFPFLARMHEKIWDMGLHVSLCVSDGACPYACPRAAARLLLKRIFRINITMLERFSKSVGKFQICLKSGIRRTLNFTTYTHFWLQLYPRYISVGAKVVPWIKNCGKTCNIHFMSNTCFRKCCSFLDY
jgi:hypothetical protein